MDPENLQVIIDEGLKSASEEANRRLAAQDKKLPTIETTVEASIQTNYRQPAQLEQRLTEMRFDPPKPATPKSEGMVNETLFFALAGAGTGATGPFCNVYQTETQWKLLGGTVTGGGGTETIDAITIGNIETPPADGTFYWLVCNMTANEEDGVLLPGGDLTYVTTGSGNSVPDNDMPEIGSLSGQLNISLGEWMGDVFIPAGCGNIQIFHCPGTLSYSRV